MRTAFIQALTDAAERDSRIMLLVGDLGFGVVVDFAKRFPDQFLNVGVAEQNMAGVATGLALSGRIVFTYSIANFPILRCLEQLRNDVCYHGANVISVSVGCGFCYGALGMTHHATEDLAIMRALPTMTVLAPGDPAETRAATRHLAQGIGPAYLRLGRAGEPDVHTDDVSWECGKAIVVRDGRDATLIATGCMLKTAVVVSDALAAEAISLRILSMHTLAPLDSRAVLDAASETGRIFTLEEHSIVGGLGGAVAECLAELDLDRICRFRRLGLPPEFTKHIGSQDYLRKQYNLDKEGIQKTIIGQLTEWGL